MVSTNGTTSTPYPFPSQALDLGDLAEASPVESVAGDSQARTQDHLYKTYQTNVKGKRAYKIIRKDVNQIISSVDLLSGITRPRKTPFNRWRPSLQ